jgi:hypothetical protein
MSVNPYRKPIAEFRRLTAWLAHVREQTDARVETVNRCVENLDRALPKLVLLGQPILEVDPVTAAAGGPHVVLQSALLLPVGGIGVVRWTPEALKHADTRPNGLIETAPNYFQPYDRCEPNLRIALQTQLSQLIDLLADEVA